MLNRIGIDLSWVVLRLAATAVICSIIALGAFADNVYLKNGQRLTGVVHDEGGEIVYVETQGGRVSVLRENIERIERSSPLENRLHEARIEESRGSLSRAIEIYAESLQQASDEAQRQTIYRLLDSAIRRYVNELLNQDPLQHGLNNIEEVEALKRYISDPGLLSQLQMALRRIHASTAEAYYDQGKRYERENDYTKAIECFVVLLDHFPDNPRTRNIGRAVADLYARKGEQLYQRARGPSSEAREALESALEITADHSLALFYLGLIAVDERRFEAAQRYLAQVNPAALSPVNVNRLSVARSRIESNLRTAASPEPERQVIVEPPPPAPQTPQTDSSSWDGIQRRLSGVWQSIVGAMSGLGDDAERLDFMKRWAGIALGVAGAFLLLWYWPNRYVNQDISSRRVVYHNWRVIVKYTGVLGLLAYILDKWRREAPVKRCPACNRSIDNPDLFENFDFHICPYCQAEIKPPFELAEVIQSRAEAIAASRVFAQVDDSQRQEMLGLIEMLMAYGKKIRASDIHIEPEEGRNLIRYRVDGVMTETITIPSALNSLLVSCIKILCNLNIAEKRLPQDGHFRHKILGDEINVRVSTIPTRVGEKSVLRLLDQKIANVSLNSLGMRDETLEKYRAAITAPHGIILATGPTGSGKTTLHYASLQYINDGAKNIVTVEDPIEYELDGINQIQHNTATGLTFATALRSILRQDPDVIMVGEIRDRETGEIAINAALTGHLVFSTLHTIDTSTAISRLADIGVDVKMISSALRAIVAQRLVRKLCPHCRKTGVATAQELRSLGVEGRLVEGQGVYRPRGCKQCLNTGYLGRTGIYELLIPNQDARSMIEKGATTSELRQASRKAGLSTLRQEGVYKALAGVTSIEEVIRVTTEDALLEPEEA